MVPYDLSYHQASQFKVTLTQLLGKSSYKKLQLPR
jgi:hypothetical protein